MLVSDIALMENGDEVEVTFTWGVARGVLQGSERLWLGSADEGGPRIRTAHRKAARWVLSVVPVPNGAPKVLMPLPCDPDSCRPVHTCGAVEVQR